MQTGRRTLLTCLDHGGTAGVAASALVFIEATQIAPTKGWLAATGLQFRNSAPPQRAERQGSRQAAGLLRDQIRLCVPFSSPISRA